MQKTDFDFEILLGEDESTDGTREICIEYAKKYPDKIRLFLHKRENVIYINGNPTGRFNFLYNLTISKGKYIALCEGDDYWTDPLKLQKQVDFLEKNEDYNVCCTYADKLVNDKKEDIYTPPPINNKYYTITDVINYGNFCSTLTLLFRNNFSIPKWLFLTPYGDIPIICLATQDSKLKKLPFNSANYRVHSSGIFSGTSSIRNKYNHILTLKILHDNLLKNEVKEQCYQKIKYTSRNQIRKALNTRKLLWGLKYTFLYFKIIFKIKN